MREYVSWRVHQFLDQIQSDLQIKRRYERIFWKTLFQKKANGEDYGQILTRTFNLPYHYFIGLKMLDCGSGPFDTLKRFHDAEERWAIDPLADYYNQLWAKYGSPDDKTRETMLVDGRFEAIPFDTGYFDFISAFNSLDHCEDYHKAICELQRVLKPKGYLAIIVEINHEPKVCEPIKIPYEWWHDFETDFEIIISRTYLYFGGPIYEAIKPNITRIPLYGVTQYKLFSQPLILVALFQKRSDIL